MLSVPELAKRYAFPDSLTSPWVRTCFVSSIDGAATDASGLSGGFGGDDDSTIFHVWRSLADVIVVGAGTARAEGYGPVLPSEIHQDLRRELGLAPLPPIAIVSGRLDVPERLIASGQILITSAHSDPARRAELAATMDVIVAGSQAIDWPEALRQLAERGLLRIQCEGGPRLHGDLIGADVVDELCVNFAAVLAGGPAPRIAHGPNASAHAMRLADTIVGDGLLATRWIRDTTS